MPLKLSFDKNIKTLTTIPGWAEDYNESQRGGKSNAVNAYLDSAWAFRAVSIRADTVASAPLELKDRNDEEIENHQVLKLLANVNTEWNAGDLWRYTESAFCVYGCAYWQKVRAGSRITDLIFLNPAGVTINYDSTGIKSFTQHIGSNKMEFPREDVIYFRGSYDPSSDLSGLAPLAFASLAAQGEKNADQFMSAFFNNYAVPPLILTTDQPVTDSLVEKVQGWWNRMFKGAKNQFKTGVVGNGLKPVQLSSNIKDMEFGVTRTEMHRTICVALGVDELLLSATGAADRTPVDAALYHLYTTTIIPRWRYYEEVLNAELIPEYPDLVKQGAYFEFDQTDVKSLQDDQNAWAITLSTLVEKGILKPETVAIELGYEMKDVPGYDENGKKEEETEPEPVVPSVVPSIEEEQQPMQPSMLSIELDKWCRKACKSLKAGKEAVVDFVSDEIPDDVYTYIMDELKSCKSEKQIKEVFREVKQQSNNQNGMWALARALNRATYLLAETANIKE